MYLPIVRWRSSSTIALNFDSLRLLRGMWMLFGGVDLQLLDHRVPERAFGKHALYCQMQRTARGAFLHFLEIGFVDATGVTAVAVIRLVFAFIAAHAKLRSVAHDDVIAGVDVWRVLRLVLAVQTQSDLACKAADNLFIAVKQQPGTLDVVVP